MRHLNEFIDLFVYDTLQWRLFPLNMSIHQPRKMTNLMASSKCTYFFKSTMCKMCARTWMGNWIVMTQGKKMFIVYGVGQCSSERALENSSHKHINVSTLRCWYWPSLWAGISVPLNATPNTVGGPNLKTAMFSKANFKSLHESFYNSNHTYTGERYLILDIFICNRKSWMSPWAEIIIIHAVKNWGDNSIKTLELA